MTKKANLPPLKPLPVPTTEAACNALIQQLGVEQRESARKAVDRDEEIASLKASYDRQIAAHEAEADRLVAAVYGYCEAHRDELTDGEKRKSFRFAAGTVSWRNRPASVTLRNIEKIIEHCLGSKRLTERFLRVKHEVNKEAMLADPETAKTIKGVKIASAGEDFAVEPFQAKPTDAARAAE